MFRCTPRYGPPPVYKATTVSGARAPERIPVNTNQEHKPESPGVLADFNPVQAGEQFLRGALSPLQQLVSSPQNLVLGLGIMATASAINVATHGQSAPIFYAIRAQQGIRAGIKALNTAAHARTGKELESAFYHAGVAAVCLAGAKQSLGQAGIATENMGQVRAITRNFQELPNACANSTRPFTNGLAFQRLNNMVFQRQPRVAIIDEFHTPTADINADGIPEISHGQVIATLIEQHGGAKTCHFGDAKNFNFVRQIASKSEEILKQVENGEQIDAVNVSIGFPISLKTMRSWLPETNVSLDNLHIHASKLRFWVLTSENDGVDRAILALEKLTARGIPVYVSAGNGGPDSMNVLSLAKGVISVSAVNTQNVLLPSSVSNSLNTTAQGVFGVTQVKGGYNFTGGRHVDVPASGLAHRSRVLDFAGYPIADRLAGPAEYALKAQFQNTPEKCPLPATHPIHSRVFATRELAERGLVPPITAARQAAGHLDFETFDKQLYFTSGPNQTLIYNPDASGRPGQIGAISGTSFAAPEKLSQDLRITYANWKDALKMGEPLIMCKTEDGTASE